MSEIDKLLNVLLLDTDKGGKEEEENGRDFLMNVMNQGKGNLLSGKTPRTVDRIKKVSDTGIDKLKSHFVQAAAKLEVERTGKTVSKHVVNLYSTGVDIDEDPIIRGSMAEVLLFFAHRENRSERFVENVRQVENRQGSDHTLVGDSSEK